MENLINDLITHANKNQNGFTVNIKNGKIHEFKPSDKLRYVTAIKTIITIEHYKETVTQYKEVIRHQTYIIYPFLFKDGKIKNNNFYMGGWYNEKENSYYIEIVQIFENKIEAMITGEYLRQYSIYDLLEKKELIVKDYFEALKDDDLKLTECQYVNIAPNINKGETTQ
ncbi:MAG: hypothetical protein EHM34_00280 [Nitrosopumilales archaeon]|nr:MAG: hypothetical protein EHM34_00280 [Nitrosopumilales archaeon]